MFCLKNQQQVEGAGIQFGVILFQHIQEVFSDRQFFLRMADMQGTTESGVAKHIVSIGDDGRELRDKIDALTHQVITGSIIRVGIKTIHFEYAARKDIHNVVPFQFDNIHFRFLFQRHVVVNQVTEREQFFLIRQTAGEQQVSHFFEAEAFLLDDGV